MNVDEKSKIYNKGVKEGQKHPVPSPDTLKLITSMTTEINQVKVTQAEQGKDISYIKEKMDDHFSKIDTFIESADSKYICEKEFTTYKEGNDEEVNGIKKNINKMFWTVLLGVIGFLVWVFKTFITNVLEKL